MGVDKEANGGGKDALELEGESKDAAPNFENILENLGAFGHWQRVIFVLISLADIHAAFAVLSPVFINATPVWSCVEWDDGRVPDNTTGADAWQEECTLNDTQCVGFEFYDDFTSIVSQFLLVCDKRYISDTITSVQMVGLALGAAFCGQLSDLIGRKKTYFLVYYFMITFGFISSFSTHWIMYMVCRFLCGIGFGGLMVVASVYPMEFVGKTWRVCCGTLGFWALGIMLMAPLGYFLRDWRYLSAVIFATGFPYIVQWLWIPESPRWLIQQHRIDEAMAILEKIATKNGRTPPTRSQLEALAENGGEKHRRYTYIDIFKRAKYAKRAIVMFFAWFTTFLVYYGVSYNMQSLSGNRYLNMFLSGFVDLIAMMSVILQLNFLGRRRSLLVYTGVAGICLLSVLFIIVADKQLDYGSAILGLSLVGKASALSGTYTAQIYTAELFPTVIRNAGVGVGSIAGRLGGILSPQIRALGEVNAMAPYILCVVLACIVVPLAFLLPETAGKELEDQYGHDPQSKKAVTDDTDTPNNNDTPNGDTKQPAADQSCSTKL